MEITVNTCIISIKMSITIQTMQWKKWKFKQNLIYFQTSVAQVRKGSYSNQARSTTKLLHKKSYNQ